MLQIHQKDMFQIPLNKDYKKVYKVILSCSCKEHLDVANRLITYFYVKWNNDFYLKRLEKLYERKKLKLWY